LAGWGRKISTSRPAWAIQQDSTVSKRKTKPNKTNEKKRRKVFGLLLDT
jgi:hypothetical protein